MQLGESQSTNSAPSRQHRGESHAHTVQFYESDAYLAKVVSDYIANGLGNGQPAVVIATSGHVQQVWGRLRLKGFELDLLEQSNQLQLLDAETVMARFMVKGKPDADRFNSVLHGVMRKAASSRPNRTVRAYGEMVDILCKQENPTAALELEKLWNDAARKYDFTLLCGYDVASFIGDRAVADYSAVCGVHDHVYKPQA